MLRLESGKAWFEEFLDALRNEETRMAFRERLGFLARSLGVANVNGLVDLAVSDGRHLTFLLLDWAKRERDRVSGNRIRALEGNVVIMDHTHWLVAKQMFGAEKARELELKAWEDRQAA